MGVLQAGKQAAAQETRRTRDSELGDEEAREEADDTEVISNLGETTPGVRRVPLA